MKLLLVVGIFGIAAALPGRALAHVGRALPVATDFTARIATTVPGIAAKVVDGDQTLWLRVPPTADISVPGTLGEPLLRFDRRGVWLNLHSPTAQSDGIDRFDLRPSASGLPPLWHRLAGGHSYAWHEHRLHLLEPLARQTGSAGPWSVPVVVGGRRLGLRGVLDYTSPGAAWAWLAGTAALLLAAAAASVRSTTAVAAFALAATLAVWAIRVGRALYGRPDVATVGWIDIALTSAIGALLVFGLTRPDAGTRVFTAFFVGLGAVYEGLTMLPVLTHSIALNAIPSVVSRILELVALGAGAGALAGSALGHLRSEPA